MNLHFSVIIFENMNDENGRNGRVGYFDTARVISIYWIVYITHLRNYLDESIEAYWSDELFDITRSCVTLLMFISGYLLSKYKFNKIQDAVFFYKRRFIRFYILFAISALTLYLMNFNEGLGLLVTTLLGISSYMPPQPGTLWFISMLMSFYLLTPLISKIFNYFNTPCCIVILLTLTVVFIFLEKNFPIDNRLHINFFTFSLGLKFGEANYLNKIISKPLIGVIAIFIYLSLILLRLTSNIVYNFDVIIGGLSLFYVSKWISISSITKIMAILSYGSMALYLYHRQCFIIEDYMYRHYIGMTGSYGSTSLWFAIAIIIPSSICIAYFIQKMYDKVLCTYKTNQ